MGSHKIGDTLTLELDIIFLHFRQVEQLKEEVKDLQSQKADLLAELRDEKVRIVSVNLFLAYLFVRKKKSDNILVQW